MSGKSNEKRENFAAFRQRFLRYLSANDSVTELSKKFGALEKNFERVDFVLDLLEKSKLNVELTKEPKSDEIAVKFREEGNEMYKIKKVKEAWEFYTKSIGFAENNSVNLGLAYANRSAVLFEMNLHRHCLMSLGNHEFDFGVSGLVPFVQNVTFPIVSANLNFDKEPSLSSISKSVVLEVSGRKIGVIGYLTPDTKLMSSPGAVQFLDIVESVRQESEVLDRQGVKIIIALGHSGFESDKQIAKEVPLVDVVIGGHTNTFLWNGPQPDLEVPEDLYPKVIEQPSGKKVPVVQAYAYTKYLGKLNVTFDDNGDLIHFLGEPELLDTHIAQDRDMLDLLEKYRPEVAALDKKVVGKSRVLLDANMNKCRTVECNIGNMMADAMVMYMAEQFVENEGWTDFPIGIVNGGSLRTTIDPTSRGGNITRGELLGCLPFSNQVVSLKITGADLIKTLEIGARSNGETSRGEFLQFSGLHVVFNWKKPPFSRVVSVKVRCGNCKVPIYEPVIPDQEYGVVTTSFLTNGGDDHLKLRDAKDKKVQDLDDVGLVEWYLEKQSPVYPEEQGRIRFLEEIEKETTPSGEDGDKAGASLCSPGALVLLVAYHLFNSFEVR